MAGSDLNIYEAISNRYYKLTNAEKKVADYVLRNRTGAQYMSISELAEEIGVAEATITRFCHSLELRGYNHFKLSLAKAASTDSRDDSEDGVSPDVGSLTELCRELYGAHTAALNQTISLIEPEKIQQALELLLAAERVHCMGAGGSMLIANEAAHVFSGVSPKFYPVSDSHLQATAAALMSSRDVVLFFSYSGSTDDIVDLITLAKGHGAKVILITRYERSPGAKVADVVLKCGSNEGPLQLGSMSAKFAQLFLVDVLFHEYCRVEPEETAQNRVLVANALTARHL